MKYAIQIVGVGGQGVLLASMVLGNAAMSAGYDVAMSEVHGMAQRGGSVLCTLRFGEGTISPLEAAGGFCKGVSVPYTFPLGGSLRAVGK